MPPTNTSIDPVTADDFATIALLGREIWHAHYAGIITLDQIDYMLTERYTTEKLHQYLDAEDRWLKLLKVSGRAAGYFSYALTTMPAEMKVEQLYLLHEFQGRGLGRLMMRHIDAQARMRNIGILTLQVNRQNQRAIDFYLSAGFNVRKAAIFDIGNGYIMDDYVMEKSL